MKTKKEVDIGIGVLLVISLAPFIEFLGRGWWGAVLACV